MLINRAILISLLMLIGVGLTSISTWTLVFHSATSMTPISSPHWVLQRLPIVIGIVMIVLGFRMLSATRVSRPMDDIDDEDRPAA